MDIILTQAQEQEFIEALLSALSRGELEQVVYFSLNMQLDEIVQRGNRRDEVRELVLWTNKEGKAGPLLAAARKENSGNPKLKAFAAQFEGGGGTPTAPVELPRDAQPPLAPPSQETLEALVFGPQQDSRLALTFLRSAIDTARSVARLTVPRIFNGQHDGRYMYGTGWLIAPGVMITNHHVIDARDRRPKPQGLGEAPAAPPDFQKQAEQIIIHFDYYSGEKPGNDTLELRQARLLVQNVELDYAIIELAQPDKVADRPPLKVALQPALLARGDRLNITQHPRGKAMRFAIRNNFYVRPGDKPVKLLYQTDTEPGASGSPVCDDEWQVLALHHASVDVPPQQVPQEVKNGQPAVVTVLNEAISLLAILDNVPPPTKGRIMAAQTGG